MIGEKLIKSGYGMPKQSEQAFFFFFFLTEDVVGYLRNKEL